MSQTVGRFQVSHSFVPVKTGRFTVTNQHKHHHHQQHCTTTTISSGTRFVLSISDEGRRLSDDSSADPGESPE